jgi:hypothetical protein
MRQTLAIGSGTPPAQARGITGDFETILNAGSTADTATPITTSNVLVTTSSAGGVRLFAPTPGDRVFLVNASGATTTLYPHSGGTVNGTTTLSFSNAKGAVLFAVSATDWRSIPVVPT